MDLHLQINTTIATSFGNNLDSQKNIRKHSLVHNNPNVLKDNTRGGSDLGSLNFDQCNIPTISAGAELDCKSREDI